MKNVNIEKDLKDVCKLIAHTQTGLEYLDKYDVFKLCISSFIIDDGKIKLVEDFYYNYDTNPYTVIDMYTKDELIKIYIVIKFGPQIAGLAFKDLNVEYDQVKLLSEISNALERANSIESSLKYEEENSKNDINEAN